MLRNIKNEVHVIRYTSLGHAHVVTNNENIYIYIYILFSMFIRSKYRSIVVSYSNWHTISIASPFLLSISKTLILFVLNAATKFFLYISRWIIY